MFERWRESMDRADRERQEAIDRHRREERDRLDARLAADAAKIKERYTLIGPGADALAFIIAQNYLILEASRSAAESAAAAAAPPGPVM